MDKPPFGYILLCKQEGWEKKKGGPAVSPTQGWQQLTEASATHCFRDPNLSSSLVFEKVTSSNVQAFDRADTCKHWALLFLSGSAAQLSEGHY